MASARPYMKFHDQKAGTTDRVRRRLGPFLMEHGCVSYCGVVSLDWTYQKGGFFRKVSATYFLDGWELYCIRADGADVKPTILKDEDKLVVVIKRWLLQGLR